MRAGARACCRVERQGPRPRRRRRWRRRKEQQRRDPTPCFRRHRPIPSRFLFCSSAWRQRRRRRTTRKKNTAARKARPGERKEKCSACRGRQRQCWPRRSRKTRRPLSNLAAAPAHLLGREKHRARDSKRVRVALSFSAEKETRVQAAFALQTFESDFGSILLSHSSNKKKTF